MQDLNDLRFFAAVATHGGFSAAARALGVPKSRLSKHVSALEVRLGVRLVERTTRKFKVTELGEAFHRQCEAVVAGAEEAEAMVLRATAEPHGLLRVSCPPGISSHLLASMMPGFMAAYPKLAVQLLVSNRRVDVIEERIDVAIRVRTSLSTDPGLMLRVLGRNRHILVASPEFAALHRGGITPETVPSLPTLSLGEDDGEAVWQLADAGGGQREVRHRPVLRCGDVNVVLAAAAAGLGIALAGDDVASQAIRGGRLVQVMPEWSASDGIVHMVFASKRGLLPGTRAFIDHLVREFPAAVARCRAAGGG